MPQPLTLMAQERHALLVGISEYPQYSDNDSPWPKEKNGKGCTAGQATQGSRKFKIVWL